MSQRAALIKRARARLKQTGAPRWEMSFLLLLTAGTGFLASFSLLHLGLTRMAVRYPVAVMVAYGAFLLYLWLWLRHQRRREDGARHRDAGDAGSWIDAVDGLSLPSPRGGGGSFGGRGGSFGGGGAGDTFDGPVAAGLTASNPPPARGNTVRGPGKFLGKLDVDEDAAKFLLIVLLVALLAVLTGYVIYIAPTLLAEVLVDSVLVTGLYRHLRHEDRRHWLATALRKTWWYFLLVALLLLAAGALLQSWYPEINSIGDVPW